MFSIFEPLMGQSLINVGSL